MTPDEIRQRWPHAPDCACDVCIGYCHRPGWFLPDEVRPAAEFLGLTLQEFFDRYLVVDWWGAGEKHPEEIGVLGPGKPDEYGQLASMSFVWSPGDCIFLKEGRCSIHAVKPYECRQAHHAHEGDPAYADVHLEVAKVWASEEGKAMLRAVGFDPDHLTLPEPTMLDALAMLGAWRE